MNISYDNNAVKNNKVERHVQAFIDGVVNGSSRAHESVKIYQDGKSKSYYIKISLPAISVFDRLDLEARLDPENTASYKANRDLLLKHLTYQRMKKDAENGREFNDIIVEYLLSYDKDKPLKVWGGQHRSKAIMEAYESKQTSRFHGFRVYFDLSKSQRSELALISNTNINVSNDLFDRQLEEIYVGTNLREWCYKTGLLKEGEDFPDKSSTSDKISTKLARTFIVNFFKGSAEVKKIGKDNLDKNIYEPYICTSGSELDENYYSLIDTHGDKLWRNKKLTDAGKAFARLHKAQVNAVKKSKSIPTKKGFRNKAFTASVLAGWSYVAGLLQNVDNRLQVHYQIPKTTKSIPDPLNAQGMSKFSHDQDGPTYRGLGTRQSTKDNQRMAQVFLARSGEANGPLDKRLLNRAVSTVIGLKVLKTGYTKF